MNFPSRLLCCAALLLPQPALAQDFLGPIEDFVEDLTPRRAPAPRPAAEEPAVEEGVTEAPPPIPRPRPDDLDEAPEDETQPAEEGPAREEEPLPPAPAEVPAPPAPEPDRVYQVACPALLSGAVTGEMLPPIAEGFCRAQSPLSITALNVGGKAIAFSAPVTTNCAMAGALADWAGDVDAYASAALESGLAELQTGTGYACRNRYGAEDGFVSEHGFANALDISALVLEDGRTIAVKGDWLPATDLEGRLLRFSHGAACGKFTTVLGPEANADHEDHLHFDLGCHGATCTTQICE